MISILFAILACASTVTEETAADSYRDDLFLVVDVDQVVIRQVPVNPMVVDQLGRPDVAAAFAFEVENNGEVPVQLKSFMVTQTFADSEVEIECTVLNTMSTYIEFNDLESRFGGRRYGHDPKAELITSPIVTGGYQTVELIVVCEVEYDIYHPRDGHPRSYSIGLAEEYDILVLDDEGSIVTPAIEMQVEDDGNMYWLGGTVDFKP